MSILAIDQGTTSTRALLVEESGHSHIVESIHHQQVYSEAGWVEHDPEELLGNIIRCIQSTDNISAIGIDNQGESCLAWDAESKKAISPVLVWQDNRTQSIIKELKREGHQPLVQQKTGLPLDCYFSASKLGWIMQNIPQAETLYHRGQLRLGTTDAFFLDRLTGKFVTDISTASRTSLMNLSTGQWDEQLCKLFNVPIDSLPKIVTSTGDFGTFFSNGRNIPVTASIVDQQAALFGQGCLASGDAKITFGTGAFAMVNSGSRIINAPDQGLLPTVAWQLEQNDPVYALDGGIYNAGSAIDWAKSLGLFDDYQQINQFSKPAAIERGLAFVPALSGLACPHWDRQAAGLWIGMTLDSKPDDMLQSILEGIAFRSAEVIRAMQLLTPLKDSIHIDGGLSINPYFCQFLADVLDKRIITREQAEFTALGTARLAGADIPMEDFPTKIYSPVSDKQRFIERFSEAVSRSKQWN